MIASLEQIWNAAMHPLLDPTGWHGLAYGLVTKKLLDTLRLVRNAAMNMRKSQRSDKTEE